MTTLLLLILIAARPSVSRRGDSVAGHINAHTTLRYASPVRVRARWQVAFPEAHQKAGLLVTCYYRRLLDYDSPALRARQRQIDRLNQKAGRP